MKLKCQKSLVVTIAAVLALLAGWFPLPTAAQVSSELQAPADDPATLLSPPTLQIVSMATSGVSDDNLMAFIASFPSAFSITAQGIICLQGMGVSSGVTLAMLNHDLFLNTNPSALPPYRWRARKLNRRSFRRHICRTQPIRRK